MKGDGKLSTLGDVIDLQSGFAFKSGEYRDEGHFLVRIANVQDGYLSLEKPKFVKLDTKTQRFALSDGDILTSLTGNIGRVAEVLPEHLPAALNQRVARIAPKKGAEIDRRYLLHFLSSPAFSFFLQDASHGVAQANVSPKAIREVPIPLPPLEEQQRIVAFLDRALEGLSRSRTLAEANLQNARELLGSTLQAVFDDDSILWNDTALVDLGSVVTGSTPKTSDKGNLGDHLPFVKPGDFLPDGSLVYDNQGLSKKGASVSRVLPAGCSLMVCIGATIGKAGYCSRPIATNQQINAVIPKDGISGEYLYYQMLTPKFQADVMRGSGQATLPIINKGKWSKLTVRVPNDLEKQADIVARLSNIRMEIEQFRVQNQRQISDLEDLRQSLFLKAFASEFT